MAGSGDVVVISGCSSGFGLRAAVDLAVRGFRVVATMRDLGKRARLDAAAAAAPGGPAAIEVEALDVTDAASIARCVEGVLARHGRIDGLVNNAGYGIGGFVHDLALGEIRAQFETNFFGLVALTKAVLPSMIARRGGRIVNVASIAGRVALPGMAAYCASKFAVVGFSESLRHELAPLGIWVSVVEPGSFRTDIFDTNRRVAAGAADPGSPFAETTRRMTGFVDRMVGRMPTDVTPVVRAIHRGLTARRPPLHMLVGLDAKAQRAARALLPERAFDAIVAWRVTGSGAKNGAKNGA